ncbi:flagellar basal body P-ring formation chaperone FlgA [uncultured Cohaesibacter sp.]|uniref:flagellar basal body P-ring formation chaperone FlgA n=1 Tax=uncultured Cohaesibacter sp. TaxID=1002546 RepID=UPI002AAA8008|nr:flagellar basal body P-ring formation chaperone FlgA [uncultured Cohaesibacter sp.]
MRFSLNKYRDRKASDLGRKIKAAGFAALTAGAILLARPAAWATTFDADTAILKKNVTVDTRLVTLGDLFKNAGSYANKAVFRAPSLGQSGTIQADRVIDAALQAGLSKITTNNISVVRVARLSELVTEMDILSKLEAQLKAKGYVDDTAKLNIELTNHLSDQHAAPGGFSPFEIRSLRYDRMSGRFSANLQIYGRDDLGVIRLGGEAMETVMVPVLSRTVQRGEIISKSDVTLTPMPRQKAQTSSAATLDEVVGKAARQSLRAGIIANAAYFTEPDMVKRSDMVTIVFNAGNLNLSIMGKALSDGSKGDVIPVQNSQTSRVIRAEVIGHGLLEIGQPGSIVASLGAN